MYPLGIDDRLKKTPIVESLVLPHPLYQGDRLSSPTSIGLCITHPSLNKALGSRFLAPKSSRPSSRCSSLSDVDLREHVDRSFLARILSDRWPPFGSNRPCMCEFCVCSSCSSRGVCSLPLPSPFPSLSHQFDHEIREDRATQEVNPYQFIAVSKSAVCTDVAEA